MLVFAGLGFADAAFLTFESFRGVIPPCTTSGCDTVLTSAYSHLGPIPLSLLGVLYYLSVIVLIVLFLDTNNYRYLRWASWIVFAGFAMSAVFVGLQAFVLHAYCQYCLASAGITTVLAVCGLSAIRNNPTS